MSSIQQQRMVVEQLRRRPASRESQSPRLWRTSRNMLWTINCLIVSWLGSPVRELILSERSHGLVRSSKKYIMEHKSEDCLLIGFQGRTPNDPFRERSSCNVL